MKFPILLARPAWLRHFAKVTFVTSIVVILYLAIGRQVSVINIANIDKVQHLLAFGWLTGLAFLGWEQRRLWRVLMLLGFGVAIEILQMSVGYRTASILDLLADAVGIAIAEASLHWYLSWLNKHQVIPHKPIL